MISLNTRDIRFMLEKLSLPDDLKELLNKLLLDNDKSISDDVADELRDLCTDRLDRYGFDVDYHPLEDGEILEALIDKLYVG